MPANLTPEYRKAEKDYRAAHTAAAKRTCLETLLRLIPKHKGTDKMQADLKRRLARLREEETLSGRKEKKVPVFKVQKEGAGQVVLLGAPNAGKSQFLSALTHARATVAEHPFSTHLPQPGMALFEDVRIQLVDTPPVTKDYMELWMPDTVRQGDRALLVVDLSDDGLLERLEAIVARLSEAKVTLAATTPAGGLEGGRICRKTVIAANKLDQPGAADRLAILREFYGKRFDIWPVSAKTGANMDAVPAKLFELLGVIRVYTKEPGKKLDMRHPYVTPAGSTLLDLAVRVHRDFEHTLKSARIWGSGKYTGMHVKRDHVLADRDVVELHE